MRFRAKSINCPSLVAPGLKQTFIHLLTDCAYPCCEYLILQRPCTQNPLCQYRMIYHIPLRGPDVLLFTHPSSYFSERGLVVNTLSKQQAAERGPHERRFIPYRRPFVATVLENKELRTSGSSRSTRIMTISLEPGIRFVYPFFQLNIFLLFILPSTSLSHLTLRNSYRAGDHVLVYCDNEALIQRCCKILAINPSSMITFQSEGIKVVHTIKCAIMTILPKTFEPPFHTPCKIYEALTVGFSFPPPPRGNATNYYQGRELTLQPPVGNWLKSMLRFTADPQEQETLRAMLNELETNVRHLCCSLLV